VTIPVPSLDDRRFQDLVDEAKRRIAQRCPEWTDHNVSDPGITLVELYAWMTDQLIYRLNRIPDRLYLAFLDLLGLEPFPPAAARVPLTFWLSSPQPTTVRIPAGTRAATVRTETEEAIVFETVADLDLVHSELVALLSSPAPTGAAAPTYRDLTTDLLRGNPVPAFANPPVPGDALYFGLSEAVPSCAVTLRFRASIEGVGVDPSWPPLAWEAWGGEGWLPCEVERDETGGLNRDGDVVLHVPGGHAPSLLSRIRAGWLRVRVTPPETGQPTYSSSPTVSGLVAFTIGGTVEAMNAELVELDDLGPSEGVPGGRFLLGRRPLVRGPAEPILEVGREGGEWEAWTLVDDFASSGPDDRHFTLDLAAGEVRLGPAVRAADGTLIRHGATPAQGAHLRLRRYWVGGGARGNVAARTVRVLRSSIPYIAGVENRHPARGGVDGETVDQARLRGPLALRTRQRAVTLEDYEALARQAAPEAGRIAAIPAGEGEPALAVRVLVVPALSSPDGRLEFAQLVPAQATLQRIAQALDQTRVLGSRISVEPPLYRGVTVVARLRASGRANPSRLQGDALTALYRYLSPIEGGPEGGGWPFGRPVSVGELYAVLQRLPGTELVEDLRLFPADPLTGQRGESVARIELEPGALVFSYEHQVLVEGGAPRRGAPGGAP
jgi:predicted phage baseplate assembly protein